MYSSEIIEFLKHHNHIISKTQLENILEDSPQVLEVIDINSKKAIIASDLNYQYEFDLIDYLKVKSVADLMRYCEKRNYFIGGDELYLSCMLAKSPEIKEIRYIPENEHSKYAKYKFSFSNRDYSYEVNLLTYDEACKDLRVKEKNKVYKKIKS